MWNMLLSQTKATFGARYGAAKIKIMKAVKPSVRFGAAKIKMHNEYSVHDGF